MAMSNAERQRRFRQRRLTSGEQVRLEFRVAQADAAAFKALAKRWQTSQADAFLRLLTASEKNGGARKQEPAHSEAAPSDMLGQADAALNNVSNWLAWGAGALKSDDDKDIAFRLSDDVAKLRRRVLKRYPGNE